MTARDTELVLAAVSITLVGALLGAPPLATAALTVVATLSLVGIVYGYNRIADARAGDERNAAIAARRGVVISQIVLGVVGFALSMVALPPATRVAMLAIIGIGVPYSLTLGHARGFRLKNVFVLKNALIGVGWGFLVVLGAAKFSHTIAAVAAFAAVQVFIGSALRDLADVDDDRRAGVSTLPVRLGRRRALLVLELVNVISLFPLALLWSATPILSVALAAVVAWRAALVSGLRGRNGNLATCYVMLLTTLLYRGVA